MYLIQSFVLCYDRRLHWSPANNTLLPNLSKAKQELASKLMIDKETFLRRSCDLFSGQYFLFLAIGHIEKFAFYVLPI